MPLLLLNEVPRYECLLEAAKEFPDLDPSAATAYLHLLRTSDEAFAAVDRHLSEHQLSSGRFGVLMLLWRAQAAGREGGARTPAELAEAAGVTRATMTGLIDTLERDGLVRREPDASDRRRMGVHLTPRAGHFLRQVLPDHFRLVADLMAPLSEAERRTLVRLLGKISSRSAEAAPARRRSVA